MNSINSRAARMRGLLILAVPSVVVIAALLTMLTGADASADARSSAPRVAVVIDGVGVPAENYTSSTVTMCPQAARIRLRFFRKGGRPASHRRYRIYWTTGDDYWTTGDETWRSSAGLTGRTGTAQARIGGRLTGIQVSANGYNHYFTVRYRNCGTSVRRLKVSRLYGVRGDNRPHVRLAGAVYAQRSDGSRRPYAHGRVEVRNGTTGHRVAFLRASAAGRFSGQVAVSASTRLVVAAAGGPTGSRRRIDYGRSWVARPTRTRLIEIPRWMRHRRVSYSPSASFSPHLANYAGRFADPTLVRLGRTYYAASTTGSRLNLPLMSSKNLTTWRPRPALTRYVAYSSWPGFNDAMPMAPAWAARTGSRENVKRISQWAPSLAKVGRRRFVAAFSAATRATNGHDRHSCIGLAVSRKPAGPYHPLRKPLLCDPTTKFGVIDPDLFVDPRSHHIYLVWAAEGIPHHRRGRLAIRRLNVAGTGWGKGSRRHDLLTYSQRWEGVVMENPSMIRYHGTLYLFYSGNAFRTRRYATGYAICRSVTGPCTKPQRRPLLATRGRIVGPGGADAFVDVHGRLRLAYAAWRRGHVSQPGGPGRLLHIALLARRHHGRLGVRRMTQ